ncbi:MAG: MFS transporter, partial [Bradyrhizobium sp.]|nr:MFS transporter [Bradyrhizobium sp.]
MTTAVVHAETGAPRQGWRILLWLTPLTALWTLLIYWLPAIQTSGVPTSGHQLVAHAFIALGLWL